MHPLNGNYYRRILHFRTSFQYRIHRTQSNSYHSSMKPNLKDQIQKARNWLQPFIDGFRLLSGECSQAYDARKRVNTGQQLTRSELLVLRQAPRDLIRAIPLLAFFCIPLVGYLGPLIGYKFPKQTLPWQFWTESQRRNFFFEDMKRRSAYFSSVRRQLMFESVEEFSQSLKQHKTKGQPLQDLNSGHLNALAASWDIFPARLTTIPSILKAFEPSMRKKLGGKYTDFNADDKLLIAEGIKNLSEKELAFACLERGILPSSQCRKEMQKVLKSWLNLYDILGKSSSDSKMLALLHAPVFIGYNNKD